MGRVLREWKTSCKRCGKELRTVEIDTVTVGSTIYRFCRACSFEYANLKPVWTIDIQQFIRSDW